MDVLKKVHPRGPNSFREVEEILTPDAHTAVFKLKKPAPYMMRSFSAYESPIVPKHLLEGQDVKEASLTSCPSRRCFGTIGDSYAENERII